MTGEVGTDRRSGMLMTIDDVARETGLSRMTVWRTVQRGELAGERLSPQKLVIYRRDFDRWRAEREEAAAAAAAGS